MEPYQRFDWCLNSIFKRLYKLLFQDVFQKEIQYPIPYYLVVLIYAVSFYGLDYTLITQHTRVVVVALTMLFALIEVCFMNKHESVHLNVFVFI